MRDRLVSLLCVLALLAIAQPQTGSVLIEGPDLPVVRIVNTQTQASWTCTVRQGSCRVAGLPPGEYVATGQVNGRLWSARFRIVPGTEEKVRLREPAKARPESMPAPAAAPPAPTAAPPPKPAPAPSPTAGAGAGSGAAAKAANYATVRVFYATDRQRGNSTVPARFFTGDRSTDGAVHLGVAEVSIPRDHRMGMMERPSILRLEFREDPEKHVVLMRVLPAERTQFYRMLSERVQSSRKKEALVFVHGYNVEFKQAAERTAQLSYDLGFDGAPILYSWPSRGRLDSYLADGDAVQWTVPHLKQTLAEIQRMSGAETIHLVAHSMGNRALTGALQELALEGTLSKRFRHVVLTAPDIDRDVFLNLAANLRRTADQVTLYVSTKDVALVAASTLCQCTRVGQGPLFIDGIETVDATAVDTGLLAHSYFGDSTSVLSDLKRLLERGSGPAERAGPPRLPNEREYRLEQVPMGPGFYWRLVPPAQ